MELYDVSDKALVGINPDCILVKLCEKGKSHAVYSFMKDFDVMIMRL
jgi:hypothetical protein